MCVCVCVCVCVFDLTVAHVCIVLTRLSLIDPDWGNDFAEPDKWDLISSHFGSNVEQTLEPNQSAVPSDTET